VAIVPATIVPPDLEAHGRRIDPPILRRLGAYTRVEWSPQADALIAALAESAWVGPTAAAFILS
jgi:hypothetical protein